jgi:hypothetical protein
VCRGAASPRLLNSFPTPVPGFLGAGLALFLQRNEKQGEPGEPQGLSHSSKLRPVWSRGRPRLPGCYGGYGQGVTLLLTFTQLHPLLHAVLSCPASNISGCEASRSLPCLIAVLGKRPQPLPWSSLYHHRKGTARTIALCTKDPHSQAPRPQRWCQCNVISLSLRKTTHLEALESSAQSSGLA